MKQISVKFAGVFAVLAFAVTAVTPASAQTIEELQALIAQLQSQIAALAGGTTSPSTTTAYTYTRDLTIGATGADVVALQTFLESRGFLTIPVGVSKGYFGELTRAALAQYQMSKGITPAVGYFGPITRAAVNQDTVIVTPTPGTPTPGTPTPGSGLQGGEASLEDFDLKSEDDAEEGQMKHVATIEFDVEDADVQINRADLEFVFTGTTTNGADSDPWDVFETITLMVDGDEIAEADVDDEDDWLRDDSPFVFRLSNIDYIAEEGDTVEIEVYLTAMSNVDDSANADWTIAVDDDGIRATDGAGIQNYIGDDSTTVAFDIDEEGGDEAIEIRSSSSDPDATLLLVKDDDDSDWHEVFVFRLEAEENDIDIEDLVLNVVLNSGATSTVDNVISDMRVEIDGEDFDDYSLTSTTATTTNITFDIDKDATIDADDIVDVVVWVEFNQTTGNYPDGTTFQVQTVSVSGEGVDNVSDTVTVSGDAHTLTIAAADISGFDWEVNSTGNILDFYFTVKAEEEDFTVLSSSIDDTVTGTATTSAGVLSLSAGDAATVSAGTEYRVSVGDTATFRVRYTLTGSNGDYAEVRMESIVGEKLPTGDQVSPTATINISS